VPIHYSALLLTAAVPISEKNSNNQRRHWNQINKALSTAVPNRVRGGG